jgi:outer membrane protein OmpA-like peptidoglycan-associated protein
MVLTANLKGLPKNFTMEVEIKTEGAGGNGVGTIWRFMTKGGSQALALNLPMQLEDDSPQHGVCRLSVFAGDPTGSMEGVANLEAKLNPQQPVLWGLWVQDGRLRVYANGTRLVDVNQLKLEDIEYVEVEAAVVDQAPEMAVGLRRVRFAESAPDFSKALVSSGRFVTHGILFDTDSDRIKPESAPVIRQISRGFEKDPNLKMLIEGHTDSTGDAARNLDLSKRRAEAVKSVLVSQFNVGASRLTTAGLGATKPMDTNDTPQGRAQNRRVEFVRQ